MLYQLDSQKRHPVPDLETEWYYWTNTYYYHADDYTDARAKGLSLVNSEQGVSSYETWSGTFQLKQPPGRNNLAGPIEGVLDRGTLIYPGLRNVLNYMLIRLQWADGTTGYKRWRRPWSAEEVAGGRFEPLTVALMTFYFTHPLNGVTICSANGSPLVSAKADPLVRSWQMRRGTQRMSRAVLI